MFALVADVPRYPEFLPWCNEGALLEQQGPVVVARVGMSISGLKKTFTTRNTQVEGRSIKLELVDGPFSLLDGTWAFLPLGRPGSPAQACKIEFDLRYAFANRAFEAVLSPVFDRVANTFVDSFVQRARQVYGER